MAAAKVKGKKKVLRVGDHVRFPYGPREAEAVVIEDRGNLGIGGRQIVRVRLIGWESSKPSPDNTEEGSFELPAADVTLVR